jgi:hypothetical protein
LNFHRVAPQAVSGGNEAKLLKEGAAAFLVKSEKSLENNSAVLIQAVQAVVQEQKRNCDR